MDSFVPFAQQIRVDTYFEFASIVKDPTLRRKGFDSTSTPS